MPTNMGIKDLVCVNVFVDGNYQYQEPGMIVSKTGEDTFDVMVFGRNGQTRFMQNMKAGDNDGEFTTDPR